MLTDKQILHIVNHDLGEAVAQLVPYLEEQGIRDATITLAFHQATELPFILLWNPDGPVLAFAPYVPQSADFLQAELDAENVPDPEAALRWANRQRWDIMATRRVRYQEEHANGC